MSCARAVIEPRCLAFNADLHAASTVQPPVVKTVADELGVLWRVALRTDPLAFTTPVVLRSLVGTLFYVDWSVLMMVGYVLENKTK